MEEFWHFTTHEKGVKLVQKYGSSVVIKSKGVDDECVVRKQEIAVV